MTTLDLREVVNFVGTLPAGIDADEMLERIAERFPSVTCGDLPKIAALIRADEERIQGEIASLQYVQQVADRADPSDDETLEASLSRLAAGDREAARILDELRSPSRRAWDAIMNAAVAIHPDWRHSAAGWHAPKAKDHPERDPERLVAWFERTYPAEAARITAKVLAN